ncbi:MAG TPA: DUF2336 domain-containing protein [Sphingomicrobium sp.]|nr:DUF2336 domain-containing protein [Sphingomicrobium sp.]
MAEEWPIEPASADQPRAPARGAGDRLSTVRVDFFLDPAERLTEQERALMTAMLHCLVGDIADEIRSALPSGTTAANDDGNLNLVDSLSAARLLDRPALVRLLLRRADEERITAAAKARSGRREARVIQGLVSHEDGAVAAAAMSLILARGRRRDRFGQCLLHFDDLPPAEAETLVQLIAAGLRRELSAGHAEADALLTAAGGQVAQRHDPDSGIEALTGRLVQLLDEIGGLSDDLIASAAMEGEMIFVGQTLSRRSAIRGDVALDELLSGDDVRVMALMRISGVRREVAASLLAGVGDLLGIGDPGRAIAAFDRMSDAQVEEARSWLGSDPAYRAAVGRLGMDHGQRSV